MYYIPQIPRYKLKEDFHSTDTYDRFVENKSKMPTDWFYNHNDITYEFNEIGYRSPTLESIDNKDFFVVFGCSNTEGIGLRLEDTYADIISKKLNLPYLNFGRGGASINFVFQANILFRTFFNRKPKFVIVQWPQPERYAAWDNSDYPHLLLPQNFNTISNENITKLYEARLLTMNNTIKENFFNIMAIQQLWQNSGCKYIDFTISVKDTYDCHYAENNILRIDYDRLEMNLFARDLMHPGREKNYEIADKLLNSI